MTILLHLIETVRFSDKLSTMILYLSRVFDTPKMFIPRRLNDCSKWEWEGMGIARWESHGNGNWLQNWEWSVYIYNQLLICCHPSSTICT